MKYIQAALSFVLTAKALALALATRTVPCCFGLSALISGKNYTIGQLSDGQTRIGGDLPPSTFCLSDTSIDDDADRGCIITTPETQFQCDQGAASVPGFTIGCNGLVSYDGSTEFWECQTGDNYEANIYREKWDLDCTPIELVASGCLPDCASPPPPPPPPPPIPTPSSCPPNFSSADTFQYPHFIGPIDSTNSDTISGDSYNGSITPTLSTIYNFDIPPSYAGKSCSLIFLFPALSALTTSSFTFSGNGKVSVSRLVAAAGEDVTWADAPAVAVVYPDITVAPGAEEGGYVIAGFECPAGETVAFEFGEGAGGTTSLVYFQDYGPSPIGVYIFPC